MVHDGPALAPPARSRSPAAGVRVPRRRARRARRADLRLLRPRVLVLLRARGGLPRAGRGLPGRARGGLPGPGADPRAPAAVIDARGPHARAAVGPRPAAP